MPPHRLIVTTAAVAALAFGAASPAVAEEQVPASGPDDRISTVPVNLAKLVDGVNSRLTSAVGYQYTIAKDGQVVAEDGVGNARRAVDGQLDMTTTSRVEVMSVTKNMTAIALLKLLDEKNVSVDAPIGKYLPFAWPKTAGFRASGSGLITFRHLLTHTSGINQAWIAAPDSAQLGNTWAGLRNHAAYGATPNPAPGNYKNANYALMRVLIPRLDGMFVVTEATAYKRYLKVLNRDVFAPAGVPAVTCFAPDDTKATLVYNNTVPNGTGFLPELDGDEAVHCGGHMGLHLSSRDLAKVVVYLRHTEKLLPAGVRQAMLDGRLGWNEGSNNGTDTGVWWHGGDGGWAGGRQVHSCVMAMPQGYSASLIVNSQTGLIVNGKPAGACRALLDAYKDSVK